MLSAEFNRRAERKLVTPIATPGPVSAQRVAWASSEGLVDSPQVADRIIETSQGVVKHIRAAGVPGTYCTIGAYLLPCGRARL